MLIFRRRLRILLALSLAERRTNDDKMPGVKHMWSELRIEPKPTVSVGDTELRANPRCEPQDFLGNCKGNCMSA